MLSITGEILQVFSKSNPIIPQEIFFHLYAVLHFVVKQKGLTALDTKGKLGQ